MMDPAVNACQGVRLFTAYKLIMALAEIYYRGRLNRPLVTS